MKRFYFIFLPVVLVHWYPIVYPEYFVCRGGGIASSSFFEKKKNEKKHPRSIFCTCTNIILVLAFITGGCSEGLGVF